MRGGPFEHSSTGRIPGSVHDKSDAAMAGAAVTISDAERGFSRSLVTDDAGEFVYSTRRWLMWGRATSSVEPLVK
jgi:hypothetical protein